MTAKAQYSMICDLCGKTLTGPSRDDEQEARDAAIKCGWRGDVSDVSGSMDICPNCQSEYDMVVAAQGRAHE